jgi:hypothetical protein
MSHTNTKRRVLACAIFPALLATVINVKSASSSNLNQITDPECEGNACAQVTLNWDQAKERYTVHNNSSDQWVRVDAANLAATATTCVEPSKDAFLSLTSIVGTYKAKFDATCAP